MAFPAQVTGQLPGHIWLSLNLPFLQTKREEEHKLIKSKVVNDEEVARVPLAFAMVKLMRSLPQEVMEANLPRYPRDREAGWGREMRLALLLLPLSLLVEVTIC